MATKLNNQQRALVDKCVEQDFETKRIIELVREDYPNADRRAITARICYMRSKKEENVEDEEEEVCAPIECYEMVQDILVSSVHSDKSKVAMIKAFFGLVD